MKKWILLITAVWLCVLLCSCDIADTLKIPSVSRTEETAIVPDPYFVIIPDELTYSSGYKPVESSYSYNELPLEGEKQLYDKLLENCYSIAPEKSEETGRYAMPQVKVDHPLTEAQVRTAIKALTDDRPEIFWTTGTIGYYSDDASTVIQMYSIYSPQEVDSRVNAVRAAEGEFFATVPEGLSEFERELMVHDHIIGSIVYDDDVDTEDIENNDPDIYNVYGALVNKEAVCEGYARAFQILMNGLGIDCVDIVGHSVNEMHMWNAAKLGGSWYYVDTTWDDREETYARYIYCNVSEDFILEDHTLSPMFYDLSDEEINGETGDYSANIMNLFVPDCTDSSMNYYYQQSPRLIDYDGEDVKEGLLLSAERQEEYFVFYIDEILDYDSAVSLLFVDYPQYFFSYINAVNDALTDYSVDSSNTGYYTHELSRIVAVELHYY